MLSLQLENFELNYNYYTKMNVKKGKEPYSQPVTEILELVFEENILETGSGNNVDDGYDDNDLGDLD